MPAMRDDTATSDLDGNLGKIYAIYICGFLAIAIVLLIVEQISGSAALTGVIFAGLTIAVYLMIGVQARNGSISEYLLAGRGVPPASNGLAAAAVWTSLAAITGLAGTLYASGFDGHALLTGLLTGLVLIGVLIAPYLRKLGAQTLPDFFGARFGAGVQALAALLLVLSLSGLLLAQILAIAHIGRETFSLPSAWTAWVAVLVVALPVFLGGMKGVTWSQVAQYFFAFLAVLVAVTIAAVQISGWPLPALAFGEALDHVSAVEIELIEKELADAGTLKPHAAAFLQIDLVNYLALTLSVALGTATLPHLLSRFLTTRSVRETRLSVAWSGLFALLVALMLPAYAVYTKSEIYGLIAKQTALEYLPDWLAPHLRADHVRVHGVSLAMLDEARSTLASASQDRTSQAALLKARAAASPSAAQLLALDETVKSAVLDAARGSLAKSDEEVWTAFRRTVLPAAAKNAGNPSGMLTEGSLWIDPLSFMLVAPDAAMPVAHMGGLAAGLAAAGVLASLIAGASGLLLALAAALGHDLYFRLADRNAPEERRLLALRLSVILFAAAAGSIAFRAPADFVSTAAWSFSLLASGLFPALVLGIWWKRATSWGAAAGMITGFGLALYYIAGPQFFPLAFYDTWGQVSASSDEARDQLEALRSAWSAAEGEAKLTASAALVSHARTLCDWFGIQSSGAALFGAPVGFAVTILVSLITPRPGSEMASLVDEMRRAKGPEILPLEPTQDP